MSVEPKGGQDALLVRTPGQRLALLAADGSPVAILVGLHALPLALTLREGTVGEGWGRGWTRSSRSGTVPFGWRTLFCELQ